MDERTFIYSEKALKFIVKTEQKIKDKLSYFITILKKSSHLVYQVMIKVLKISFCWEALK